MNLEKNHYAQDHSLQPELKFIHFTEGENVTGQARFIGTIPDYMCTFRSTVNLIKSAEEQGTLKSGMEIIEPAYDSAAIAMACVAAERGYRLTLTVPETLDSDGITILKELGARVIVTSSVEGCKGAARKAAEIASTDPQRYFLPSNTIDSDNPCVHSHQQQTEVPESRNNLIHVSVSRTSTISAASGRSHYTQHCNGRQMISA